MKLGISLFKRYDQESVIKLLFHTAINERLAIRYLTYISDAAKPRIQEKLEKTYNEEIASLLKLGDIEKSAKVGMELEGMKRKEQSLPNYRYIGSLISRYLKYKKEIDERYTSKRNDIKKIVEKNPELSGQMLDLEMRLKELNSMEQNIFGRNLILKSLLPEEYRARFRTN